MDKRDGKKSIFDRIKSLWNSLPGFVRFIGTLLGIVIAVKALIPAAAVEITHFGASPEVIEPGDTSILSWEISGANSITIEPGIGAVSSNGSLSVSPSQTTTYKLVISGKEENKTASCTVTVKNDSPLITSFDASPNSIKAGESAVLNWHVAGTSNVIIEPDIGTAAPSGTSSVSPAKTTTYKLMASNGDKKDVAYCTITVGDNLTAPKGEQVTQKSNLTSNKYDLSIPQDNQSPPQANSTASQNNLTSQNTNPTNQGSRPTVNFFNANPDMINKGESSSLNWSVSSATKISIEPGIGTVGLTGTQRIFPNQNTTYILTATNEFGSADATKVVYVQDSSASTSSSTQVSSKTLPAPKQLLPANGTAFDNSTSGTTLEWTAVSGAANYTVEIDTYDSNSNSWLSESAGSSIIPGISTTSYPFEFEAKGPGRWRVWAVGSDGKESKKSDWWNFNTV